MRRRPWGPSRPPSYEERPCRGESSFASEMGLVGGEANRFRAIDDRRVAEPGEQGGVASVFVLRVAATLWRLLSNGVEPFSDPFPCRSAGVWGLGRHGAAKQPRAALRRGAWRRAIEPL